MSTRATNAQRRTDRSRQRSLQHLAANLRRDLAHARGTPDELAALLEQVAHELREDPVARLRWRAMRDEVRP